MPSQIAPFPGTCCSVKPLLGLLPPSLALKSRPCYSALRVAPARAAQPSTLVPIRAVLVSAWFQLVPSRLAPGLRSVRLNSAFGPGQHDPAQRLVSTHSVQPSALTLARAIQLHFGFSQRLIPARALSPNSLGRCNAARYRFRPLLPSKPFGPAGATRPTTIETLGAQYCAGSGIASARAYFGFSPLGSS